MGHTTCGAWLLLMFVQHNAAPENVFIFLYVQSKFGTQLPWSSPPIERNLMVVEIYFVQNFVLHLSSL